MLSSMLFEQLGEQINWPAPLPVPRASDDSNGPVETGLAQGTLLHGPLALVPTMSALISFRACFPSRAARYMRPLICAGCRGPRAMRPLTNAKKQRANWPDGRRCYYLHRAPQRGCAVAQSVGPDDAPMPQPVTAGPVFVQRSILSRQY